MKKLLIFLGAFAVHAHAACPQTVDVITTLVPRSQERHRPQQLVGLDEFTYRLDAGPFYGTASLTGSYAKTFKADHLARALFGSALFCADNHNPYLKIQGESYQGTSRDPKALFADYFYLPSNYSGTVSFDPHIKNVAADIDLYFGLNSVHEGLYLRVHSPLVYSQWTLGMCEQIITPGTLNYPDGYFTPNFLPVASLNSRFTQYGCGKSPGNGTIDQSGDAVTIIDGGAGNIVTTDFIVTMEGLHFSKLTRSEHKTRLADIRVELGKIFAETEKYSWGAHLELLIPTGTKKKGHYLFEPVIGNGHHWEFGGGIHGKYICSKDHNLDTHTILHADFNITHLFKTNQRRTFDLQKQPLSRYMLASYFTPAVVHLVAGGSGTVPSAQFAEKYAPLANISTLDVAVGCDIQIDGSAFIHYHRKKWDFDCGYNIWYRSQEQIHCRTTAPCCDSTLPLCDPASTNRWGLKGDARMYGFDIDDDDHISDIVPLSATESAATIYNGTSQNTLDCNGITDINALVDNPQGAFETAGGDALIVCPEISGTPGINTSLDPIFLKCSDLDIKGTRSISHTVFAHASHTGEWRDYNTYCGLGGSAEFGMRDNRNNNFAVSQWTIWVKGGLTFD